MQRPRVYCLNLARRVLFLIKVLVQSPTTVNMRKTPVRILSLSQKRRTAIQAYAKAVSNMSFQLDDLIGGQDH